MKIHGNEKHKQKRVADGELYQNIRMQTWFQDSRQRYWAVKEDGSDGNKETSICERCRHVIRSSSNEEEEAKQQSRVGGGSREQTPVSDVVIAGSTGAGTTREVIRIDKSRGEIVDAMVGDEASEVDTEDEDWEDGGEDEDTGTDTGTDDGRISTDTQPSEVSRSPNSVVARPCTHVDSGQDDKGTGHVISVVQVSEEDTTDDSDTYLVPKYRQRKRRHESASPDERVQRRRITQGFADSGISIASDIRSDRLEEVSALKAARDGSTSKRKVISIASSPVDNMPSSPPVFKIQSEHGEHDQTVSVPGGDRTSKGIARSPVRNVPSSPSVFRIQSEHVVDERAVPVPDGDRRSDRGGENTDRQLQRVPPGLRRRPDPWVQTRAEPWSQERPARMLPWQKTPAIFAIDSRHVSSSIISFPVLARLMDWWNRGCQLCHLRQASNIQHPIEQCVRREARAIAEEARDICMQTPMHESDCIRCQGPPRICRQWQSPGRCMYPTAGWAIAIVTMLQEGDDHATDELYKYMKALEIDITDKKSVYRWFGERFKSGQVEVSRLVWVFYQLALVNEKCIDRGEFSGVGVKK